MSNFLLFFGSAMWALRRRGAGATRRGPRRGAHAKHRKTRTHSTRNHRPTTPPPPAPTTGEHPMPQQRPDHVTEYLFYFDFDHPGQRTVKITGVDDLRAAADQATAQIVQVFGFLNVSARLVAAKMRRWYAPHDRRNTAWEDISLPQPRVVHKRKPTVAEVLADIDGQTRGVDNAPPENEMYAYIVDNLSETLTRSVRDMADFAYRRAIEAGADMQMAQGEVAAVALEMVRRLTNDCLNHVLPPRA